MAVTVKFDLLNDLRKKINSKDLQSKVASEIITLIKTFTAKGISPVKGEGRFARYKDPTTYPNQLKNRTPVNLYLTGDMLNALSFRVDKNAIRIGYFSKNKQHDKAEAHNFGTATLPRRPFLPVRSGEEFNVSITRAIRDIYFDAIQSIIKNRGR